LYIFCFNFKGTLCKFLQSGKKKQTVFGWKRKVLGE